MYKKNKIIEMITLKNFLNKKQDKYTMTDISFLSPCYPNINNRRYDDYNDYNDYNDFNKDYYNSYQNRKLKQENDEIYKEYKEYTPSHLTNVYVDLVPSSEIYQDYSTFDRNTYENEGNIIIILRIIIEIDE